LPPLTSTRGNLTGIASPNLYTTGPTEGKTATCPPQRNPTERIQNETNLGENVADLERRRKSDLVKNKFADIFHVTDSPDCESIDVDISNYTDDVNVAGSLNKPSSVQFFKTIGASDYIINTLTNGHHSTFSEPPPPFERRNNHSYHEHKDFAVSQILELIDKGKAEILDHKPHTVNPLSVAVQRRKLRLILDCSNLNKYIEVPKFKYEDTKEALQYFKKGCAMFSWDLKNGYHLISIHKDFRKYLGFQFDHEGKSYYCQYTVVPFVLWDLPYLITKLFRTLVRHWRSCGIATVKFLDDGICFSDSDEKAESASVHIREDLFRAGALWSVKKSNWSPVKQCEWLGFIWDSQSFSLSGAPHRISKIKETCSSLLSLNSCHVKKLASFTGQIVSLSEVLGNCSRLTTRLSQIAIAAAPSWDSSVSLSPGILNEIRFWLDNIEILNNKSFSIQHPPSSLNIVESDASDSGCGSLLNASEKALRLFSCSKRSNHSTFRELVAASHALHSFLPKIRHSKVKLLVDNQSAARILDVGSMKVELHKIAMDIFLLCIKNGICLEVEWIPRNLNEAADAASREAIVVDTDDWGISPDFFGILNSRWGPLTIDCFANDYNAKLDRFYSLFHSPGSTGVDAFSYNWHGENCLLVPPVCVVGPTLHHLRLCKSKGVLIVPFWPSAAYWPLLLNEFKHVITDYLVVKGKNVLIHGFNTNSLLGSADFLGKMLALRIECS